MKEEMKLGELKKWINELSNEDLQSGLIFKSDDCSISGIVDLPKKASENYYHIGGEYPGPLFTKDELLSDGYDEDEIAAFAIVIVKGNYFLDLEIERSYQDRAARQMLG